MPHDDGTTRSNVVQRAPPAVSRGAAPFAAPLPTDDRATQPVGIRRLSAKPRSRCPGRPGDPCCRPDPVSRAALLALRYGPSDPRNRLPSHSPKPASDGGAEADPNLFADLRAYPIGRRLCPASRIPAAQGAASTGHPTVDRRKRSAGLPESRTPGSSLEILQITNFSITFQILQP